MAEIRRIAVLIQVATGFGRDIRRGIGRYAQTRGGWEFHSLSGGPFLAVGDLDAWHGDGVIAMVGDEKRREQLLRRGLALVNIASRLADPQMRSVVTDNAAIGRLGADHLLERGFQNLAFYGYPTSYANSEQRMRAFIDRTTEAEADVAVLRVEDWELEQQTVAVRRWLEGLPRPVGILAATDELAKIIADVCWQHGIAVPEEVAVLGVDNDEPLLEMANPALSSIDVDAFRIGYEAAAMLDELLQGNVEGTPVRTVAPRGVVTRRSTDILAVDDPDVAAALRYMRSHWNEPITVKQVVDMLSVSRRAFEKRFIKRVGRTPWQEIRRTQVEYVKQLLRDTDLPIQRIADLSAFCDPRRLSNVFREETSMTPRTYRQSLVELVKPAGNQSL